MKCLLGAELFLGSEGPAVDTRAEPLLPASAPWLWPTEREDPTACSPGFWGVGFPGFALCLGGLKTSAFSACILYFS